MEYIRKYCHLWLLVALINLILTPLTASLFQVHGGILGLVNYCVVVLAGILIAVRFWIKVLTILAAALTLMAVSLEFVYSDDLFLKLLRIYCSLAFFVILAYILIRNFLRARDIGVTVIFGAMAGYLLIGLLGGIFFELLEYFQSGSVLISGVSSSYDFYYYSFISIVTIGYGDIVPNSPAAKSLTIFLSVAGQFYMAVGIALFVGRHLSQSKNHV